ncbi:hypothetical protein [Kamptonema formosum]|nr:hypothetical protein [Oscillatoria sp. PCC 10802]
MPADCLQYSTGTSADRAGTPFQDRPFSLADRRRVPVTEVL